MNAGNPVAGIDLGPAAELLADGRAQVRIWPGGPGILVVKTRRGVFAMEDQCPHLGSPLADAAVRGRRIRCAAHGREYDMVSGACRSGRSGRLLTYPCWVEHGHVFVAVPAGRT